MKRSISGMVVAALLVPSGVADVAAQTFSSEAQRIVNRTLLPAPALRVSSPPLGLTHLIGPGLSALSPALGAVDAARLERAAAEIVPPAAAARPEAGLPVPAPTRPQLRRAAGDAAGFAASPALARMTAQDEGAGTMERVESAREFFDQAPAAKAGDGGGSPAARSGARRGDARLARSWAAPSALVGRGNDTPSRSVSEQAGVPVGAFLNTPNDGLNRPFARIVADASRHPSIESLNDVSLYSAQAEFDANGAVSWTLRFAGYRDGWSKFLNRRTLVEVAAGASGAHDSVSTYRRGFFGSRQFKNVALPAGSATLAQALARFADDYPDMVATSAAPSKVVDGYWSSSGMRDDPGQEVSWEVPVWSILARSKDDPDVTGVFIYSADKLLLRTRDIRDAARQEPELLANAPVWIRLRPSTLLPYDIAPAQIDAIRERVLKDFGATQWHDAMVEGEAYSWRVKMPAAQYLRLRKFSSAYRVTSVEFEYAAAR